VATRSPIDAAVAGDPPPAEERRAEPRRATVRLPLAPSLERRRLQVYIALLVIDAAVIVAAFLLAGWLYFGDWADRSVLLEVQLIVPVYWTVAIGNRAYSVDAALSARVGAARTIVAIALAVAIVVFLAFYLKTSESFSRVISTLGTVLAAAGLATARDALTGAVRWRCGPIGANRLLIEDGGRPVPFAHGFRLDAREHGLVPDVADPHALNRIGLYLRNMDRVTVTCAPERRRAWALVLKGANIEGEIVDDDILAMGAVGARRGADYAALVIATGPLRLTNRVLKRALDLAIGLPALLLLAPLFAVVALAIKLDDGGPVLFIQRRLGRGNRFFPIYKFRSMRLADVDSDGAVSTARGDARVTRVGRWIRATSIDELPQLANVVAGDMSLVGPRPHALGSHAGEKLFWEVDDRYWQRHSLKPGLTGLAQVRGFRGATGEEHDLTSRLQSDLEYLEGWTIWRDLAILFATLRVLVHRNAY
jgi:lipopolysaccharide/colanic/teichoic acid biosynthesis glycosyltransferase